jgi:hypothetical protein
MTEKDLQYYKCWYKDYANSFHTTDEDSWKNLALKIDHTDYVQKHIVAIARELSLSEREVMLAETVALFHDLGRFRQYSVYRTFEDRKSMNHGLLGAITLIDNNVLKVLPGHEQQLVLQTIKFHNAFAIPNIFDDYSILFLKMIRDADKLDIFRVFIEYYESSPENRASETAFGLPDTEEYSEIVIARLNKRHTASYRSLRTENDFKLLKLSWIYGLHFDYAFTVVQENEYIRRISEKLPQTDAIRSAVKAVEHYVKQRQEM